jgi:hypothetical protein
MLIEDGSKRHRKAGNAGVRQPATRQPIFRNVNIVSMLRGRVERRGSKCSMR